MNEVIEKVEKPRGLGALLAREIQIKENIVERANEDADAVFANNVVSTTENIGGAVDFGQKKSKAKKVFKMKDLKPMTFGQKEAFESFLGGKNLLLHGLAGTGKTFIAMYLALNEINRFKLVYEKVVVIRSVVPSRDAGYLPGSIEEKARAYEQPYVDATNALYERGDAYETLKRDGKVDFCTTSYLRGITFEKCIVVVDEIQNMNYGELATLMTRAGENCRFIFCGDFRQSDFEKKSDRDGLYRFMNIVKRMEEFFKLVEFNVHDVVRSKLVKSFLTEEADYGASEAKGLNR